MPSKTSKKPKSSPSPKKAARACSEPVRLSEEGLARLAGELAARLRAGDRVILEGPMGAGKSTFARFLIEALGVSDRQAGSPTFAIAHEYDSGRLPIIHLDLYRLRSEGDLEDAGIPSYFWDRGDAVVIVEWLSQFPELEREVASGPPRDGTNHRVSLAFADSPEQRLVSVVHSNRE